MRPDTAMATVIWFVVINDNKTWAIGQPEQLGVVLLGFAKVTTDEPMNIGVVS